MPRKTKEKTEEVNIEKESNTKKVASKKSSSTKKTVSKKQPKKVATKKTPNKKVEKKVVEKEKEKEKETKTKTESKSKNKTPSTKKEVLKKTTKSTTSKKASTPKKTTTKKTTATKKEPIKIRQTSKKVEIIEYYDLPYRYNQTIVKVLAQTPTTLFVYWDISDDDRKKYIDEYGEYFFNNTKPVLIIYNKTKNYSFEVDINDFANSWYLNVTDSNCDYKIELGRRPVNQYVTISNNYLPITVSNNIESPNDRILFDTLSHFVYFRNVKTNESIKKHINLTLLNKIGKIPSIKDFYKKLYPEEVIDFDRLELNNPSSNNPTSSFK